MTNTMPNDYGTYLFTIRNIHNPNELIVKEGYYGSFPYPQNNTAIRVADIGFKEFYYLEESEIVSWTRREVQKSRPEVVCLCGSTKFKTEFEEVNRDLTLSGYIVLTVGFFMHSDKSFSITDEQKQRLDNLHKRKIDLCDRVFVINPGGYIGESTRSEIEYATKLGKRIDYYERSTLRITEPD